MLTLRYALELSMIIPAVIFAVTPLFSRLRIKSVTLLSLFGTALALIIWGLAYFGVQHEIKIKYIFMPLSAVIFILYVLMIESDTSKKLFCAFNSAMLCVFCPMFTSNIMGPQEINNTNTLGIWLLNSGIVNLCLALFLGLLFLRTLTVKIPMLLSVETIRDIWRFVFLVPMTVAAVMYWMIPISSAVVMTGRVRPISIVIVSLFVASVFMFYHVFWWIAVKITEGAKLQEELNLLGIEKKRYNELRKYMAETRALRHDFRQHIAVIHELAESGKDNELRAYVSKLAENISTGYKSFCANSAVDAAASHYDGSAASINAVIEWKLNLPSELPVSEPEYCAMLGNLIENALNAVKDLPVSRRRIKVISSMLSDSMLGLSIDNEYSGSVMFWDNGLPIAMREGHGTGLISVKNTVNHYNGSISIKAGEEIFSVDIILYC